MHSNEVVNRIRNNSPLTFGIRTVIPFMLPFILEIPDIYISDSAQMILLIFAATIDLGLIFLIDKQENQSEEEVFKNKIARDAYSNVYELNERKRNYMVECSYNKHFVIPAKTLPYNVHEYISEICHSFKNLISQITLINKEYVSVSFIYRYTYDNANREDISWKWITGKEQTMQTPLDEFVKKRNTVYNTLIYDKVTSVFYNDKLEMANEGMYFISSRDERHDKIGSIFGVQLMFSNNAKSFVEGILVISTYGKRFVESNDGREVNTLRKLIIDDLFPYYQRLLETEMGVLYLRHIGENDKIK